MEMPGPNLAEDNYFDMLPEAVREGFNRLRWHWRYDTPEKYQHSIKGYYRMIGGIDLELAKIRARLKERGLDKNTVVILMGDNGYFSGERQLAGKWLMYDNSIRVPMIIYDPRSKGGRTVDEMVLNIDLPATILDLAGIHPPAQYQGKSLEGLLQDKNAKINRDTILIEHLWEFENIPPSEGVRTSDWKYLRYVNDKSIEELYYLKEDPMEVNNLATEPEYSSTLSALRQKCDALALQFSDKNMGVPSGLRVEYIREPDKVEILDSLPEFSWIVPTEAVFQQAYQILVSSQKEFLDQNRGDVWDSRQVRSDQSINIELGGEALKSGSTYFWKVRIWDGNNRVSDYSKVQSFRTGQYDKSISTPNTFQMERIPPESFRQTAPEHFFADFGKDAFGRLELTYESEDFDTLLVRLGEKLEGGVIDRNPGGTIRFQEAQLPVSPGKHSYRLELPPDQRNTGPAAVQLPDSFGVLMPFRYCEIEGAGDVSSSDLHQIAYFHYFEDDLSYFTSSDTILNQIWDLCKYSMKATSFAGLYVDGDRERIPYEADAYINQLSHYAADAEYAIGKQTIEYFMDHPTWPTEWQLHNVMMVYQDYMYTGDTELIHAFYENLRQKTLMELARADGLISVESPEMSGEFMLRLGFADSTQRLRDIVDWPSGTIRFGNQEATQRGERDGYEMLAINTMVNAFFYHNMVLMAELASIVGKPGEEDYFKMMAAKVKQAVNTLLFDQEKQVYVDGEGSLHSALHASMAPMAFGMVSPLSEKSVSEHIKSRGMACSVYGAQYLLEALYLGGEAEYALELMTATHDRSWWNMIATGSTITTEAWDLIYKPNQDWNHAWGAAPGNIIPRYLWGIRPKVPGFAAVSIQPQLADLTSSEIVFPTMRGAISCTYEKVNDRLTSYRITLPGNMVGDFELGAASGLVVTRNGRPVHSQFGSIRLEPGENRIELRINSF